MHQWVASYPSIAFSLEGSPNAVTSSQSVVDIVPTHCAQKRKHPSGSYHTNPLLPADPDPFWIQNSISRWQGGLPSWLPPTSTNSDGSAVTHGLMPTSTSSKFNFWSVLVPLLASQKQYPWQFDVIALQNRAVKTADWLLPSIYCHFLTVRNQFDALEYFSILSFQQHCCPLADKQLYLDALTG